MAGNTTDFVWNLHGCSIIDGPHGCHLIPDKKSFVKVIHIHAIISRKPECFAYYRLSLTLKDAGGEGGPKVPIGFSIGRHLSQDHAMVTKILDFIHKHLF